MAIVGLGGIGNILYDNCKNLGTIITITRDKMKKKVEKLEKELDRLSEESEKLSAESITGALKISSKSLHF